MLAAATAVAATGMFMAAPNASAGPSDVANPGFESGNASWHEKVTPFAGHPVNNSSAWPARTGTGKAELGGQGLTGMSRISQQVTVPASRVPVLSFWVRSDVVHSGASGFGFRQLVVEATAEDGTPYELHDRMNKGGTNGSYEQVTVTLPDAFYRSAPQKVNISFTVIEDAANRMPFLIDDVAMEYRFKRIDRPVTIPGGIFRPVGG
ncbi:hypothetical protein SUDANB120_06603 (plasmid) [Streptomyces sp. enrichment culture]|uniref:hypothetical protein n=1 Tax=Streptomyces TaxID=1883 RepID=UPI0016729BD7|nr:MULTISPECIES: hypothetical protein [Streptomyces]MBD3575279.1 hypothetical protein [Streptomyces sp. KD18]GGS92008.1 hypothetical protein GCM10010286_15930 [Streptomyces toxytricini]